MKTILKFQIHPYNNLLPLTEAAVLLDLQVQHGLMQLWVEMDPTHPMVPRPITLYGTGYTVPDDATYRFTVQQNDLVWHAYE